jgi:hypothetical protein
LRGKKKLNKYLMQNFVKSYESEQQKSNQAAKVAQILYENDAKNLAINGIATKTVLYSILSAIAVLELCAALFFYLSGAFSVPTFPSVAIGASIAIAYHYYLHAVLVSTCAAIAFERKHHSKAMKSETVINIIICLVLLLVAALAVVILGRNGFAAYRMNQYEAKTASVPVDSARSKPSVSVALLTKNGQLITERANALANVQNAENAAKTIENAQITQNNAQKRKEYDAQTVQLSTVVGTSAFFVELLLLLLAYSIATAKRAATIETESNEYIILNSSVTQNNAQNGLSVTQNNGTERSVTQSVTQPNNGLLTQKNDTVTQPTVTQNDNSVTQKLDKLTELLERMITQPSPQIAMETEKRQIGFQNKACKQCQKPILDAKSDRKEFCETKCRIEFWKDKTGQEVIKGK